VASVVRRHRRLPRARRRLGQARRGRRRVRTRRRSRRARPRRTERATAAHEDPRSVLVALADVSIAGACTIGVVGAVTFEAWLALLIPLGLFLVLAYNLELAGGRFHSDVWFGLAWGGFPVLNGYAAVAGDVRGATVLAAVFAVLLSLAQRVLSNHVRYVRRQVIAVRGELELADASKESLDARRLTAPAETGLRLLSLATVVLAATLLAFRI
jgi:hypothetical protein